MNSALHPGRFGRRELVIPRGRSIYKRFDLSKVPPTRRGQAIAVQLDAWRPLPDATVWHGWQGGIAHAWAWSEAAPDLQPQRNESAVPESALIAPKTNGLRVLNCSDGFEGQCWRDRQLMLSRWWPVRPDEAQWRNFLRAAGYSAAPMPQPVDAEWNARPWVKSASGANAWWNAHEWEAITATTALLLLALGWQTGQWWQVRQQQQQAQQSLDAHRFEAESELTARDQTLALVDRAARMVEWVPEPSALKLLDQVTAALPDGGKLLAWEHEPGRLSLEFEADRAPNPERAVRALQQVPALEEILTERTPAADALRVQAKINASRATQ